MIFIANVLTMNGGSTFLVRACKELKARGQSPVVLVLMPKIDPKILTDLHETANVIFLWDYVLGKTKIFKSQFGIFAPVNWAALTAVLTKGNTHIHVMGGFGLLFAKRLRAHLSDSTVSVGIYHQNEFLFRPLPFLLPRDIQKGFREFAVQDTIFFNEVSRDNYARFFSINYDDAPVVPIGVEVSKADQPLPTPDLPQRIVSVGNLVPFKTYNRHIIHLLEQLSDSHPTLQYDVYGDGPDHQELVELAQSLGVSDRVMFHGRIPYSEFKTVVQGATIFVGSGTALVEAADIGVPALVGIESSVIPETYGYLDAVKGFSYNEDSADIAKVPIFDCVRAVLDNPAYREALAIRCKEKAKEFSVETTMDGFVHVACRGHTKLQPIGKMRVIRIFVSLIALGFFEKMMRQKVFSNRRSQSYDA